MRLVSVPVPLRWLLAAFVFLCLIYAWATPLFEASDELWHFGMVDAIARMGALPVQVIGTKTAYAQEGSQPPLYYLIAAALIAPIDRSDLESLRQPNPHVQAGIPHAPVNKNLVLHDSPRPPLEKTALAVYGLRLFSIALSVITVSSVYVCANLLSENHWIALLAAGLTAFNPMFLFITASVNNDNLVTALDSLIIWQLLVLLRDGFSTRRNLIIAVLIALASLSKLSGLVLVPVVALAALWVAYRKRDWRGLIVLGVLMAGIWAVLAGWWYVRNWTLYGELFGTRTMAAVAGARTDLFTFQTLLDEFQGFRITYWGLFGAVNILTFEPFYTVMDVVTILALIGLALNVWRKRANFEYLAKIGALLLVLLMGSLSVIAWTAQTYASQGRLLFPYIAATSSLLALGDSHVAGLVVGQRRAWWLPVLGVAGFAAFALVVPFASIVPQYAPPAPLTALPDTAHTVYARFGDVALIGYDAPDRRYAPGDELPITLYWQVLASSDRDYSLFIHVLNDQGGDIGKIDTYPGGGRLRTTTWQPGAIYPDSYKVPLTAQPQGSFPLRVLVGWWHYPSQEYLTAVDQLGQPIPSVVLNAGAFGDTTIHQTLNSATPIPPVAFGGAISLRAYQIVGTEIDVEWESTATLPDDYTVFVQVLDDQNHLVGQGDAPPSLPTHYWLPGEHFVTRHTLSYPQTPPAGSYRVIIGWYRPSDFSRLSTASPDNAYLLTTLTLP